MPGLSTNMKLDWSAVPNADTYTIYRDTNPLFTPAPGNQIGSSATNSYTDAGAVALPAVVALVVAYQHRRQMRHLELYRRDPSAGLRPPPSWFAENLWAILLTLSGGYGLISFFAAGDKPPTRMEVFSLVTGVASLLFMLVLVLLKRLVKTVHGIVGMLAGIVAPRA